MLSKSFAAPVFLLALTSFVNAGPDAGVVVVPGLGVPSAPVKSDVKQPSTAAPCGSGVDISQTIGSATCVSADANGHYPFSLLNFGSTAGKVTQVQVDPSGTGKSFVAAQIVSNGDGSTASGNQQISVQLPSGTECKGANNRCLVSFVGPDGTGNCAVVAQPPATTPTTPSPSPSPNPQSQAGDKKNNGSADTKGDAATGNKGPKREHAQGKRNWASR